MAPIAKKVLMARLAKARQAAGLVRVSLNFWVPKALAPAVKQAARSAAEAAAMSAPNYLSTKKLPIDERLIIALDFPSVEEAENFVDLLGDTVVFYKLGLELFMAGGYFELVERLRNRGKKIFVDLKFFDVPATVGSAVRQLAKHGASFATVHGNDAILEAAAKEKGDLKILAVTVLTSLDKGDMDDLGFKVDVGELVLSRAKRAIKLGCDGVISSGLEAPGLRSELGGNFLVVSPGIRPVKNTETDDQKRTVDVEEAFLNGADYIVVGRPIRNAPDPKKAAEEHQVRIAKLFAA
jgi:orotidine-5'-phosphate decarboxylase